eukprot:15439423-Alexandrium_andersonii.AAC.1
MMRRTPQAHPRRSRSIIECASASSARSPRHAVVVAQQRPFRPPLSMAAPRQRGGGGAGGGGGCQL